MKICLIRSQSAAHVSRRSWLKSQALATCQSRLTVRSWMPSASDLRVGQTAEEPELDDLRHARIGRRELREQIVDLEESSN